LRRRYQHPAEHPAIARANLLRMTARQHTYLPALVRAGDQ